MVWCNLFQASLSKHSLRFVFKSEYFLKTPTTKHQITIYNKMDVEEKLQQLFRLQPLQNKLLVMRKECPESYRKYVKQACIQDMKNLVNVEMDLVHTDLKLPEQSKRPPLTEHTQAVTNLKLATIMQDQAMTLQALEYL